jgi:hypothetical protein
MQNFRATCVRIVRNRVTFLEAFLVNRSGDQNKRHFLQSTSEIAHELFASIQMLQECIGRFLPLDLPGKKYR